MVFGLVGLFLFRRAAPAALSALHFGLPLSLGLGPRGARACRFRREPARLIEIGADGAVGGGRIVSAGHGRRVRDAGRPGPLALDRALGAALGRPVDGCGRLRSVRPGPSMAVMKTPRSPLPFFSTDLAKASALPAATSKWLSVSKMRIEPMRTLVDVAGLAQHGQQPTRLGLVLAPDRDLEPGAAFELFAVRGSLSPGLPGAHSR